MRRIIIALSVTLLSVAGLNAQTIKIYLKDSDPKIFEIAQIDSIVFSNDTIENVVGEEIYSDDYNEANIQAYISGLYLNLIKFETAQLYLEALRTGRLNDEVMAYEEISPDCNAIRETWIAGYSTVNRCNALITMLPNLGLSYDYKKYMYEAMIIRAFVYYNMTQLWGDIPLIVDTHIDPNISRQERSAVLGFVCNDLQYIADNVPESEFSNDLFHFRKDAVRMLLAEAQMLLGNNSQANETLQSLSHYSPIFELNLNYVGEENIFWGYQYYMREDRNNIEIYTTNMADLLLREANEYTENLVGLWNENCDVFHSVYGYWAALKRLGKAEEITGCQPYMLLMPIPSQEIMMNPHITQNPGWGTR
ncbi:MAG: RagB/SusD family nutrient uptake outer membrane protein [Bacteroidales bacterium]|nr:RagB/SusD family nutrient uptake outer membrane protein [Candidatus Liminaster caballi]